MYKYIFYIAVLLFFPLVVSAAFNTVQFPQASNILLSGTNITLVVSAGSNVADMTVNPTNVVFTLERDGGGNSSITLTSYSNYLLTNDAGVATQCGGGSVSYITLTGPVAIGTSTVTVTPTQAIACLYGGGGGSSPTTTTGEVAATPAAGGETTITTPEGTEATIKIPPHTGTYETVFKIASVDESIVGETAPSPAGNTLVSAFDLNVLSQGVEITSFSENVTLTITYSDSQVTGLDESTLKIYRWDGTQWIALESTVNKDTNTVTATTKDFSYFSVMGEPTSGEPIAEIEKPITEMTIEELTAKIAEIQAQITLLQVELEKLTEGKTLDVNLGYNDSGDKVELLQTWLAKDPEIYPEGLVTGWFGPLTEAAVIRFQEKYTEEVLSPWELTEGTGFVGTTTRAKLNTLFGTKD